MRSFLLLLSAVSVVDHPRHGPNSDAGIFLAPEGTRGLCAERPKLSWLGGVCEAVGLRACVCVYASACPCAPRRTYVASSQNFMHKTSRFSPVLLLNHPACCAAFRTFGSAFGPSPGPISTTTSCLQFRQNRISARALVSLDSFSSFPRRHTGHMIHAAPTDSLHTSAAVVFFTLHSPFPFFAPAAARALCCLPL